jgi:hypothetical protein
MWYFQAGSAAGPGGAVRPIKVVFQMYTQRVLDLAEAVGSVTVLVRKTFRFYRRSEPTKNVFNQMMEVGVQSFPGHQFDGAVHGNGVGSANGIFVSPGF